MRKEAVVAAATVTAVATVAGVAATVMQYKRRKDREKQTQRILRKFASECATPVPKLWEVANALVSDMETSLSSQEPSTLNMLVSYVTSLPNGDEKGLYYGLNMRGTNFLILCARLGGKNDPISDLHREQISIPSNVLVGTSQELFDYIAVEVAKFVSAHPADDDDATAGPKKLGVTVSYPVDQIAATSGSAIKWKCFSADDTVGKALLNDMNQALDKHGLDMQVFSLAISMEWGNFNCSKLPLTEFDASLDKESSNPGSRIFEKLISAMYLGEIVRRVLLNMAQETALFGETVPQKLATPCLLKSPDMAAMHQDTSEDHQVVGKKLNEIFGITDSTPMARKVVAEVCDIVAERGARLAGAGIVGIIKKLGRVEKRSVVTVEGGLYEHYRVFRNYLHSSVWEMLGNDLSDNVILEHSHGGSGAGALFLAACQTQNPDS
ncbi:hypothetical protein GH714_016365 [Hevea brasiliensis]|uniref:Phosphotransferase n=1 Tax=Hevea brasiliensis TaxID=3981 RepID=A0A6A6K6J1_HEVBR|nr:hypothetical protein GH714_016365 [Hevea brasiliensis]